FSGWRVTKEAVHVLMEGTPQNIDLNDIVKTIENVSGVFSIHDLHVWSITSDQNALSCHVVVNGDMTVKESQKILRLVEQELKQKEINHVTIQLENKEHEHLDTLNC